VNLPECVALAALGSRDMDNIAAAVAPGCPGGQIRILLRSLERTDSRHEAAEAARRHSRRHGESRQPWWCVYS
jgi:hypothetical protein